MINYAESHLRLVLCLLVVQLCGNLFQTVENSLAKTQGRQALQLHYLWKELHLGGRPQNSYRPPSQDSRTASPTIALSVERASPGRTPSELISAAQPRQLHYLWKELQLGGRPHNSYWPPKGHLASAQVRQEVITGNTPFSLSNFC